MELAVTPNRKYLKFNQQNLPGFQRLSLLCDLCAPARKSGVSRAESRRPQRKAANEKAT
jgi:hypothetical protein